MNDIPTPRPGQTAPVNPAYAIFDDAVKRAPQAPCTDFMDKILTYGELGDLVERAARGLQNLGIGKGDRVGICLPNCPYYVAAYYAVLKTGAIVVNFNPLYTETEIRNQLKDSGTTVMITIDVNSVYPKVAAAAAGTAVKTVVVCSLAAALPTAKSLLYRLFKRRDIASVGYSDRTISFDTLTADGAPPRAVAIDPLTDLAVLQYTGGTTGIPKGAMLSHANIAANTEQVRIWMGGDRPYGGDSFLCVLPFFHVFAMTSILNLGVAIGAKMILLPRFELGVALQVIDTKHPTLFPAVPTIYGAINSSPDIGKYDLSSIRFCVSGGAALPSAVKKRFEELTGCVVVEGYGLTEASPVLTCNPPAGINKPESIGVPMPWTEIEIRDLENPERTVPEGERGQVLGRGPQVMAGYWNNPEETAAVLQDGWLSTGDVGYMDEEGYIFLTDRIKDLIVCSGFNVYPRIIEDAIYGHPDVAEVTVIGIADEYRGESPKAFVRLKDGATASEQEILEFAKGILNPIERPSAVEIRDELPKTLIGKLSKKELVLEHIKKTGKETST